MPLLIPLYVILAISYIFLGQDLPPILSAVLKSLPVFLLILFSWRAAGPYRALLLPALLFGMGGDFTLAFNLFIVGLGSFLVGHIFYTLLWSRRLDLSRWPAIIPLLLIAAAGLWVLLPHTGDMTLAVTVYLLVIVLMAVMASLSLLVNATGLLGVYSFLLSDFVIAWDRFIEPQSWAGSVIMTTYYLAQLLIVLSVLKAAERSVASSSGQTAPLT